MGSLLTKTRTGDWRRSPRLRRVVRRACAIKLGLAFVVLLAIGAAYLRLFAGPISLQAHAETVADALASRIGPGWTVTLADTGIELQGGRPTVRTSDLEIRNPAGLTVVKAPHATVSVDPVALLTGSIAPRDIELRDLQIRGLISRDGSLRFVPEAAGAAETQSQAADSGSPQGSPGQSEPPGPSPVAQAVASLLGPLIRPSGVIGALDRASVVGAKLTLIDPDGRERAGFARISGAFDRADDGGRRVELDIDGEEGPWRVRGRVAPDSSAELAMDEVSVSDVLLLTGSPRLPRGSSARISGRVQAAFADGKLSRLDGSFASAGGTIARPRYAPIAVDRIEGEASWDEASRSMRLPRLAIDSQGTTLRLVGDIVSAGAGWKLSLRGQDATIAGIGPRDPPFKISTIAADIAFDESGARLEKAAVKGEALDLTAAGIIVPSSDGPTARALIEARGTEVRRLVRIWPDAMNPKLRAYLAARAGGGMVERLSLRSTLDAADFKTLFNDDPLSDGALQLEFAAAGAELAAIDGLPPLRGLAIEGKGTGASVALQAKAGRIEMPDGRALGIGEASYVHVNLDDPNSAAQVAFRLTGGADALASFLRSPIMKAGGGGVDLDPATVTGRVDLRASLPIVPGRIPSLAEMALQVQGTLSEVGADKIAGREKLEGGNFAVLYDSAGLSVKGEARLTGSPAQIELRSPKGGGPSELAVALTLDEAARTRRSLPSAPALAGPVPVRIAVALGGDQKGARIEADLGRASVDGLLPGWSKPAGKPGRLAFTLTETEGGASELRDVALEAGSVQARGTLTLGQSGGLERAELPSFKLSPGDDIRVQVEKAGGAYRVHLRGNNADARPLIRWLTATGKPGQARDPPDLEVDASFNILTGHHDEALTGVSAKVSAKGGELRSLQFGGRFRSAVLDAQLAKKDAGSPILSIRSGDAGATLRFVDLYRRMTGGRLTLDARTAGGVHEGRVWVEDFGLRNEPALRSIVSQAASQQQSFSEDRGIAPIARGELDQVLFNRLVADFRRSSARVDFSDVTISGPQVGFNLSGSVDFSRDRMDVNGTFVPAYMLNNAFSQLPVVGILIGGPNEGLFAVDFRVAGALANPVLTVNPLTAVAPGILRKLFGWMMPGGERAPAAAAAASAPRRREE